MILMSLRFSQAQSFVVDPDQSRLAISGTVAGFQLREQGPGSLSTSYTGEIQVVRSANGIQLAGGVLGANDSGAWRPLPDGSNGAAAANYGFLISVVLVQNVVAALRNFVTVPTSGELPVDANGAFSTTGIVNTITSADFAFRASGVVANTNGGFSFAGAVATNTADTLGHIVRTNGEEVITVPLDATVTGTFLAPDDTTIQFAGRIVARRALAPSPALTHVSPPFPAPVDGVATVKWTTVVGHSYQLQGAPTVTGAYANVGTPLVASQKETTATEPLGPLIRFFRVVLLDP